MHDDEQEPRGRAQQSVFGQQLQIVIMRVDGILIHAGLAEFSAVIKIRSCTRADDGRHFGLLDGRGPTAAGGCPACRRSSSPGFPAMYFAARQTKPRRRRARRRPAAIRAGRTSETRMTRRSRMNVSVPSSASPVARLRIPPATSRKKNAGHANETNVAGKNPPESHPVATRKRRRAQTSPSPPEIRPGDWGQMKKPAGASAVTVRPEEAEGHPVAAIAKLLRPDEHGRQGQRRQHRHPAERSPGLVSRHANSK